MDSDNVVSFSAAMARPFQPANLLTVTLCVGLIVGLALAWRQILGPPIGEAIEAVSGAVQDVVS